MKTIKTILAAMVLTAGSLTIANAQTRFHVSVNTPNVHVSAGNYQPVHRAYYSEPVYYNQPVVYNEPVVYSRPVVVHRYYERPVVVSQRYYSRPVVVRHSYYTRDYDRRDYNRHGNGHAYGHYKHGRD